GVAPERTRLPRHAKPAEAGADEFVGGRARRGAVDPGAVRPDSEQRLAEQPAHDEPVRRIDPNAQRPVAVDDLGMHTGERRGRQFEPVVERDGRRPRMRGRGAGSHKADEYDDRERDEAHGHLQLLDRRNYAAGNGGARSANRSASGRGGRRATVTTLQPATRRDRVSRTDKTNAAKTCPPRSASVSTRAVATMPTSSRSHCDGVKTANDGCPDWSERSSDSCASRKNSAPVEVRRTVSAIESRVRSHGGRNSTT